jgi:hypothetical protein
MRERKRQWFWIWVTFFFFVGALVWPLAETLLGPRAFSDVALTRAENAGGVLIVEANFRKAAGCELQRFAPVAVAGDVTTYLNFDDLDGLGQDFDREPGRQTLRIAINLGPIIADVVELRTRHLCGSRRVDSVFATIKIEDLA